MVIQNDLISILIENKYQVNIKHIILQNTINYMQNKKFKRAVLSKFAIIGNLTSDKKSVNVCTKRPTWDNGNLILTQAKKYIRQPIGIKLFWYLRISSRPQLQKDNRNIFVAIKWSNYLSHWRGINIFHSIKLLGAWTQFINTWL